MLSVIKRKGFITDVIVIFIGCLIASIGVNLFLVHAKLLSGGVTGIALIIEYISGFQSGFTVFLLNIPLFLISYKKLSKSFTIYSAIGMLSMSTSLIITKPFSSLIDVNDILLYCIYGGVLCGVGYGLVFLRNGSTGGNDIITMLIRKKYESFEIGKVGFTLNSLIVIVGAIIFGMPVALYTLISIFIQGVVLDIVLKGFSSKKLMLILTDKEDDVIQYVIKNMNRGVTSLNATGEFTHEDRRMLYCIVTARQMLELKRRVYGIDPKAFITIIDVSEVKGKGFVNI
ncbi:MAG: YitT family protein [Clostridium sp.]